VTGDPATDLLSDMKTRCKSLPLRCSDFQQNICSSAFISAYAGGGHMATLTLVLCSISVPHSLYLGLVLEGTLAAF